MPSPGGTLVGKVAIVTGAGYGIGRGIAIKLAEAGATVIVNYGHSRSAALESVRQIRGMGGRAIPVRADVSRAAEVNALVAKALEVGGTIDVLVNNAGLVGRSPLLDLEEAEWDRIVGVNLKGVYLCSRAVARAMVSQGTRGSIVHIGSIHATRSLPGRSHYAASKAGLVAMNRVMAFELAEHGIRCNVVNPGATYSESWGGALDNPEEVERVEASIPLGRIGTPSDIAEAVLFLLSPGAAYVTGASLDVDGGLLTSPTHV